MASGHNAIVALATQASDSYGDAVNASEWIVDSAVLPDVVRATTRIQSVDGQITTISQDAASPTAKRLHGTLLPGFVDLQVNGAGGRSVDEATEEALETIAAAVWNGGAVAFLPTLITAPWPTLLEQVRKVAAWISNWSGNGAEPLGIHLEGPFLVTPGAHPAEHFLDPTAERIAELLEAADGHLRLITIGGARTGAAAATRTLSEAGVTVALGHCDRSDGFKDCIDAGANAVTHLFNVMGPLHHRELSPAVLALDDQRVACPMIVDGVHVSKAMVRNAYRILGPDRTILVTDAVSAASMPDGSYTLSGMEVTLREGIVRDGNGNLAGSALTMAQAAKNFLDFIDTAGPWTVAKIASCNPARLIGSTSFGAVQSGHRAAFTLLGHDGTVSCVK